MRPKTFFIFIFSLLICVCFLQERTPVFASDKGSYTFYLNSKSSNANFVNVQAKNAKIAVKALAGITGESIFFDDFKVGEEFSISTLKRFNAVKVFSERLDNIVCDYYYTPKIYTFVIINEKRVNLHVVKSNNGVTVATPLAFDGY